MLCALTIPPAIPIQPDENPLAGDDRAIASRRESALEIQHQFPCRRKSKVHGKLGLGSSAGATIDPGV